MPLVDPLPEDHNPELIDLIQFFRGPLGTVPNSVLTMQRRPKVARAFTELNKAVMENLGTRHRRAEAADRLCRLAGRRLPLLPGAYDFAAERFGATAERMAAIWDYANSPLFSAAEKAAFDFALAAASVPNAVTPEIAAALKRHWSDDEIVEILGVIALFGYLNRWNNSMATTLEPIGVSAGKRNLTSRGWTAGKHG